MNQSYDINHSKKNGEEINSQKEECEKSDNIKIMKYNEINWELNDITSKVKENESLIYENDDSNKIAKSYLDKYLVDINNYQNNPNCKIYPKLHLNNTKEIKNVIIKEKICVNTYYQYIDVYNKLSSNSEEIKDEKTYTNNNNPLNNAENSNINYNTINMKYIIPNIVKSQIPVAIKKTIYPEIETTDEEIEIEVEKYVPYIIPVNVYVPKYYSISALESEENEIEIKKIELTKEHEDEIIKELNPHLKEIQTFNEEQIKQMKEILNISKLKAEKFKIKHPEHELIVYYDNDTSERFDFEMFEKFREIYPKDL
ncbi:conserved Plasmodium protein, unknown function [Plasmodium berghei]|uniref:PhIL1 interacting protein PIP2, putative n=2 Tax=Plasmodium berghei TaxID=5821 RepID=A0A509AMT1_PLABA|nr:PhIL1 interacting protein PIP2, putative [Plasmodium berghei ANKA]SCL94404.1 conserved Plasmodium protein, unknown function [Plasmodium berghei]SCM16010.1 conserved Plasmodium protein, unknown function [Plasmodium berghei]SCM17806.1 conserved Plasmodium protein, unknown function [Plasmodium berghei]SCN26054.1 conserved Plasmodium protein, unknown function [Plasmodium berghei]VUC56133.1 PhIL1 interacting protein PIP2, putative [Plasmodium berghei ANKA]|eukprot:XP_034421935.1 PhIL1 interacting protein PIP2, putative [Plasmodium berghei ANKA]